LGARLRAVRAGARGCELRGDDLVHHGDVGLDAEHRVGQLDGARVRALGVTHREAAHRFTAALVALRTNTSEPDGPGTAPFTSSRPRSASPCTTSRLRVVTRSLPFWPAMRRPLNTRAGVAQAPIEPGARCFLCVP